SVTLQIPSPTLAHFSPPFIRRKSIFIIFYIFPYALTPTQVTLPLGWRRNPDFMDQKELAQLLERYTRGNCTAREREWVERWYNDSLSDEASMLTERDLEADVKAVRTRLLKGKRK